MTNFARRLFFAGFACLLVHICAAPARSQTWTADNGDGTYSNPIFNEEFSDPDIIRVGEDFYLAGTTMHAMPGLPVLHSRDLINWELASYAVDRLDLGPKFRLEGGAIYGEGIWAPCLRYHNGVFYLFSNVNGQTTQLFRAASPTGPWTRTPMKRSFHDLSVLFDDDGKVYVVWNYREVHIAELDATLTDIVPGSERILITPEQGMGEGHHIYKINGKYFISSAWYMGEMRMPTARADKITGPWEVNQNISRGEDFGQALGAHLRDFRPPLTTPAPLPITPRSTNSNGRMAMHQGGFVSTPAGEWWGFSMGECNALGRCLNLSPVTWQDGWPYFGLPGNLGRTPRSWVKPTLPTQPIHAPFTRSDSFAGPTLANVWQWNHVPNNALWSLTARAGWLRLTADAGRDLWSARNTLTQRAAGPASIATVELDPRALQAGERAGLALFAQPEAYVAYDAAQKSLVMHDGETGKDVSAALAAAPLWLRVRADFRSQQAQFSYSADGKNFVDLGAPFTMLFSGVTFQGERYALFASKQAETGAAGHADFRNFTLVEPEPRGRMTPIPVGHRIALREYGREALYLVERGGAIAGSAADKEGWRVVDRKLGRVAFCRDNGCLSVDAHGALSLRKGSPTTSESFQWIEGLDGRLSLMSLSNHRYLEIAGRAARSIGPLADDSQEARLLWDELGE